MSAQTSSTASPANQDDTVCIRQETANICYDCLKERTALRILAAELQADKKISEREADRLKQEIQELENNHNLTISEHKKETDALRKIILTLNKRQVSILFGLIKFRW